MMSEVAHKPGHGFSSKCEGRLLFFMRPGRGSVEDRVVQGAGPSDFLYGYREVRKLVQGSSLLEAETHLKGTFAARCWTCLERVMYPIVGFNLQVPAVYSNWKALSRARVIVTNIDSIGMPLMLCRALGCLKARLIHISQGTTNFLDVKSEVPLRTMSQSAWVRSLYRELERVIVLGEGARRSLVEYIRLDPGLVTCLQFGVDTEFWTPGVDERHEPPYLLSVGSDSGRDYGTLMRASFPIPLKVVTRIPLDVSNPGIELVSGLTDEALRDLYRCAALVLIPLHDISQPSGQSVALQAMACGCAVVVTRTRGFWDPEGLIAGQHLEMVNPGDSGAWENTVDRLLKNPQMCSDLGKRARGRVCERYTASRFGAELGEWCRLAIEKSESQRI